MNLKRDLTEPECEKYRALCNFTDDELEIFNLRVKNKSLIEISILTHQSEATINRRLQNIKKKILRVF